MSRYEIQRLIKDAIINKTPLRTKGGKKVFVTCNLTDYPISQETDYPVKGYIEDTLSSWTPDGRFSTRLTVNENNIIGKWINPHPLQNMPINHPIYVREGNDHTLKADHSFWRKRHFAGSVTTWENHSISISVFSEGTTSFSNFTGVTNWQTYRLPSRAELIGTSWENSPFVAENHDGATQ